MDSVKTAESGGGKFTSTVPLVPWARKDPRLEPFLAFRARYDQALEAQRAAPGAVETASLCWGGTPRDPLEFSTSVTTRSSSDPPAPKKDDKDNRVILRERNRWVEKVEIKSEDDDGVVLTTERIRLWVATGDDGKLYFLECKPDGTKTVIKKGAAIPPTAFH